MIKNKKYLACGTYGKVFSVEYNGAPTCMKEYRCPTDKNGVSDDIIKEYSNKGQVVIFDGNTIKKVNEKGFVIN